MDPLHTFDGDLGLTMDSVPNSHDDPGYEIDIKPVLLDEPDLSMETSTHDDSSSSRRHLCVNCGLHIRTIKGFRLDNVEIRNIFQQWNPSEPISANSLVCKNCWDLARNAQEHSTLQEKRVGHKKVCVNCGHSVLRRRFHKLPSNNEGILETQIRNVIAKWILPHQLTSTALICHPCWLRAKRAKPQYTTESPQEVKTEPVSSEDERGTGSTFDEDSEATVILPNYTRAAVSQRSCFYPGCNQPERLRIPKNLRSRLFIDFNFYVSPSNRICRHHLEHPSGNELIEVEEPIHTFTATQIEEFTSLLKESRYVHLDFENIEIMDDNVVNYFFDLTKDDILFILREVPELSTMHRGKTALAAYLMKLTTKDSNQRISSLLNISKSTLEKLMKNVKEILIKEASVGRYLSPSENE